jgi:hypothetical protein
VVLTLICSSKQIKYTLYLTKYGNLTTNIFSHNATHVISVALVKRRVIMSLWIRCHDLSPLGELSLCTHLLYVLINCDGSQNITNGASE